MVELGYYAIGSGLQGSVEVRRAGGREGGRHRTSAAHTTTNERSERRSGGCGREGRRRRLCFCFSAAAWRLSPFADRGTGNTDHTLEGGLKTGASRGTTGHYRA